MQGMIKLTKKATEEILLELWQTAVFDDECYEVLERFIKELAKDKNKIDNYTELLISKELFNALTTTRNRNLITREQQKLLKNTIVGFFGLSVGSNAALTWLTESRADAIKIVDYDIISASNLNRLRADLHEIGISKVENVARRLLQIHPFVRVISSIETNKESIVKMFYENPKLDIVVDAIDDMEGKILLRQLAQARRIPVVSAADVGDNVILDIERYDKNPKAEPFLGRVNKSHIDNFSQLSDLERKKLIIKLVGFESNSEAMLDSLLSIGKTIPTWPQLGATAAIAGGIIATTIKKIVLNENVESGRYYFSLDDILVRGFSEKARYNDRKEKIERVKQKFKID